jgi:hypothetical protein
MTKRLSIGLSKIGVWVGQEERRSTAKPLRLCSRVCAGRTERQRDPQCNRARLYTGARACMAPRPPPAAAAIYGLPPVLLVLLVLAGAAGVGAAAAAAAAAADHFKWCLNLTHNGVLHD